MSAQSRPQEIERRHHTAGLLLPPGDAAAEPQFGLDELGERAARRLLVDGKRNFPPGKQDTTCCSWKGSGAFATERNPASGSIKSS
jgi:hypothetical protein